MKLKHLLFKTLNELFSEGRHQKVIQVDGKPPLKIDQVNGIGGVPYNQEIHYMGFEREMTPDEFLRLALNMYDKPTSWAQYKEMIDQRGLASPFFDVSWVPEVKAWQITGHEGRHRMTAVKMFWGEDVKIPVHCFVVGMRPEIVTDEMKRAPLIKQKRSSY